MLLLAAAAAVVVVDDDEVVATTDLELLDEDVVAAGCAVDGNFLSLLSSNCVFSFDVFVVLLVVVDLGCCCALSVSLIGAVEEEVAAGRFFDCQFTNSIETNFFSRSRY